MSRIYIDLSETQLRACRERRNSLYLFSKIWKGGAPLLDLYFNPDIIFWIVWPRERGLIHICTSYNLLWVRYPVLTRMLKALFLVLVISMVAIVILSSTTAPVSRIQVIFIWQPYVPFNLSEHPDQKKHNSFYSKSSATMDTPPPQADFNGTSLYAPIVDSIWAFKLNDV